MITHRSVIEELEAALPSRPIADRANTLHRVTDLFLFGAAGFSDREIALFDDVMVRLTEDIETSIRAALAKRLATIPNVPPNLIRRLAFDKEIEVAGPVLRNSERLDDVTLADNARTASQDHLLAISQRASVSEIVTDVLVERGDRKVALSTVGNAGARFSDSGHDVLVQRSKEDDDLAVGVWSRHDIPRHHLLQLFKVVSEKVRQRLEASDRQKTELIRNAMIEVSNQVQARIREQSPEYTEARRIVVALHETGDLNGAKIREFATAGKFDEITVALSIFCDLPVGACERAMVQENAELILLLAKAIGLSWDTTKAILLLRAGRGGISPDEHEQSLASFSRLRQDTARKALQFVRLRERASISKPERSRAG